MQPGGAVSPQDTGEICIQSKKCKSGCCRREPENCQSYCALKGSEGSACHTQVSGGAGAAEPGGTHENREPGSRRDLEPRGGGEGGWAERTRSREFSAGNAPPSRLGEPVHRPKVGPHRGDLESWRRGVGHGDASLSNVGSRSPGLIPANPESSSVNGHS